MSDRIQPTFDPPTAEPGPAVSLTPPSARRRPHAWRHRLLVVAKLGFAAALLTWLFVSGRLELGGLAALAPSAATPLVVALVAAWLLLPAVRWWWLLRLQHLQTSLPRVLALSWVGYFTTCFLPGATGGDLARAYLICRRHPGLRLRALASVVVDRAVGMYSLLLLTTLSGVWLVCRQGLSPAIANLAWLTLTPLAAMTLGGAILLFQAPREAGLRLLPRRWRPAWRNYLGAYRAGLTGVLTCLGLSLASSAVGVLALAAVADLLGHPLPLGVAFLAGPLVFLSNCLPVSPGGIGFAEATSDVLLNSLGILGGAEMMLLLRIFTVALSLPGALGLLHPGTTETPGPVQPGAEPVAAAATA